MSDNDIVTAYAGARVTSLVNRHDVLDQIQAAVRDTSGLSYVLYLEAPGGMGKTFLAREVLRRCQKEKDWAAPGLLVARHEVDLYHHQARSIEGFMAAFVSALEARYDATAGDLEAEDVFPVLEPDAEADAFAAYKEQRRHLQQVKDQLRGAIDELEAEQDRVKTAFLDACARLGDTRRVVVVLDTAERLTYETDRVDRVLQLSKAVPSMRAWLLEQWLPAMKNAVILLCGRPRHIPGDTFAADLCAAAEGCAGVCYQPLSLRDFSESETRQYLDAVRATAEQDGNVQALRRLAAVSDDSRRVIHLLTGGRPITLALMIDYYLVTERLLPEVKRPLAELQALPAGELECIREKVKIDIVRVFREIGRPADEAIIALAWAPMGMDAELLARVADLSPGLAKYILQALASPRMGLSFVKIRAADGRAFLHDEMYALMQEHVLGAMPERAKEVYKHIHDYYADKIKAQEQRVGALQAQQRATMQAENQEIVARLSGPGTDPQAVADALALLDDLRIEQAFYYLRENPLTGFQQSCEYAQAAVAANEANLDMQLRDQMLGFMREGFDMTSQTRGLQREAVERDSALRWGWRAIYAARPGDALRLAAYMREHEAEFMNSGGPLAWAELDVIEGWADAFTGSGLERANARLESAVQVLAGYRPASLFERDRRVVLLAQAYHVLGQVLRTQGRFRAACVAYQRALPLWRKLKREMDHSQVLNDLSYALAETGNFRRALRYCRNGLELREMLGYRYLVALSLNTFGLIEIKNDQQHRGMVHCEQALTIFRELGMPRGIGLADTALAEAYRRSAATPRLYPPAEQMRRLRLAEEYAASAVQIFGETVPERLRLVEALNELGCVYRDMSKVWPKLHSPEGPDRETLVFRGVEALEEAAGRAAGDLAYRQVDALVNLAWLYYYNDRPDEQIEDTLARAEALIPAPYLITAAAGVPRADNPMTFLYVQLSKIHVLRGRMAMRRYWQIDKYTKGEVRDAVLLEQATRQFTVALAYNELFGDDYRDMRSAKDTIYDELRGMNINEFRSIYQAVRETAREFDLECRPAAGALAARPRMRSFLEENFGTLQQIEEELAWESE